MDSSRWEANKDSNPDLSRVRESSGASPLGYVERSKGISAYVGKDSGLFKSYPRKISHQLLAGLGSKLPAGHTLRDESADNLSAVFNKISGPNDGTMCYMGALMLLPIMEVAQK